MENKDILDFDDKVNPLYKKGVEHGYWLQRGESKELDQVIERSKKMEQYHKGLLVGRREAQKEKLMEQMMQKQEKTKETDKNKGFELE